VTLLGLWEPDIDLTAAVGDVSRRMDMDIDMCAEAPIDKAGTLGLMLAPADDADAVSICPCRRCWDDAPASDPAREFAPGDTRRRMRMCPPVRKRMSEPWWGRRSVAGTGGAVFGNSDRGTESSSPNEKATGTDSVGCVSLLFGEPTPTTPVVDDSEYADDAARAGSAYRVDPVRTELSGWLLMAALR
jgi:hypothetical protein